MARITPEEARQYLAEKAAQEEWTPRKPLDEYQDGQVIRKAQVFQRQERAGLPLSNQVARGHARSEGGKAPEHLPAPREAYEIARVQPGIPEPIFTAQGDRYIPQFDANSEESRRAIDFIGTVAPDSHIVPAYFGVDGQWHALFQRGGATVDYLQRSISEHDGNFDTWIRNQIEQVYGYDESLAPAPGVDYRLVVISRRR